MAGETLVTIGTRLTCSDGASGWVSRMVVDPSSLTVTHLGIAMDQDSHRVTHLLLKETGVLGRKRVAIPISAVTRVDAGIQLNITRRQVRHLPRFTGSTALG